MAAVGLKFNFTPYKADGTAEGNVFGTMVVTGVSSDGVNYEQIDVTDITDHNMEKQFVGGAGDPGGWQIDTILEKGSKPLEPPPQVGSVIFSPQGRFAIFLNDNSILCAFDANIRKTGNITTTPKGIFQTGIEIQVCGKTIWFVPNPG